MLRALTLILLTIISHQIFGQVETNDTINQQIRHQLETRLPESWEVISLSDTITLIYSDPEGFYAGGCCPRYVEIPKEKKLLKWLRNDYLTAFYPTMMKFSDTLKIEITFSPAWSAEKTDSTKNAQDSLKLVTRPHKVQTCNNPYWQSTSSKQMIPFYSEKLHCSVFFDRPSAFNGIYKVDSEFGIPRFINIDDEILMVEQIAGLILGVSETCFTCQCEGN